MLNILNKNKYDYSISTPQDPQDFQDNNDNEKYVSYYFSNTNGLYSIDENIFNIDKPKVIKKESNENKDEQNEEEEEIQSIIIKDENLNIGKKTNNLDANNISIKTKNNIDKKVTFLIKKELPYKKIIQLEENLENTNNFQYNNNQNYNYDYDAINNNSLISQKYIQKINKKKYLTKKNLKKTPFSGKKIDLLNKKTKNNNSLNPNSNKQEKININKGKNSTFNYQPQNEHYLNYFPLKPQNLRPNVINSSIINFNSNQKNNNDNLNIDNNNDKKDFCKRNQRVFNEKENSSKEKNITNDNEKNREKTFYVPQIFESQNSSIIIGGVEYTTLLVPKQIAGKIKSKIFD
jgi:hypothetical protein